MLGIARWAEKYCTMGRKVLHDGAKAKSISRDSVPQLCVHCAVAWQCSHLFSVHNCRGSETGTPLDRWTLLLLSPTISSISNAILGAVFPEFTACSSTEHPW